MLLTQRILYVVAFDAIEARVTTQVAELSKALGAPVFLLAVVGPRYELWRASHDAQAQARENVERVAENLRQLRVRVWQTLVVKGNHAVAAMEAAQRMETDFIVLGAGERSQQDHGFVRTTAKTLARTADQHVWICKPQGDAVLQHILCAFDESRGAAQAIGVSSDLARQFNAKMQLISAISLPPAGMVLADEDERREAQQAACRALQDQRTSSIEGFNFDGITLAKNICWSQYASTAVIDEAEKHQEGLLVIGAAGRRRFPTMMLGNTAEKILRNCPSSLLVVK